MQPSTNPKRESSEHSTWQIRITQNFYQDIPLEYVSNDVPRNNSELLDCECRRHVFKSEPFFDQNEKLEEMNSNQLYTSSVKCDGQKIQVKLEDSVVFPTQSSDCSNELQIGQLIKAEPSYQDQDEELFNLADLAGHFQSPASTQSSQVEGYEELVHRNTDLPQNTKKKKVTKRHSHKHRRNSLLVSTFLTVQERPIHADPKPLQYDQCNKSFDDPCFLTEHKPTHSGVEPYSCDQFNMTCSQSGHLVVQKRTHSDDKPDSCALCSKTFSKSSNLVEHKRIRTCRKPYSCDHCKKSFSGSWDLDNHKHIHTGRKPYNCDQCNKSFRQSGNLSRHKRTHTEDKPYSCDQCNKSFRESYSVDKAQTNSHW